MQHSWYGLARQARRVPCKIVPMKKKQRGARPLQGRVALVAGATRGAGRGIACMLGEAGATVYCSGRSTRENRPARRPKNAAPFDMANRPETIEETALMVSARGGLGIHAH